MLKALMVLCVFNDAFGILHDFSGREMVEMQGAEQGGRHFAARSLVSAREGPRFCNDLILVYDGLYTYWSVLMARDNQGLFRFSG